MGVVKDWLSSILCCLCASNNSENLKSSKAEAPDYAPEAAMVAAGKYFSGKVRLI